jgi:hypothetical protein
MRCESDHEASLPLVACFPSLEALVYSGGFEHARQLEPEMYQQLLTFSGWQPLPPNGSCLVLARMDVDADGLERRHTWFVSFLATFRYVALSLHYVHTQSPLSLVFDRLSAIIAASSASSFLLERLYISIVEPHCSHQLQPGLASFLDACGARKVTVVFETVDTEVQQVSQAFLEYAKKLRKSRDVAGYGEMQ